MPVPLVVVRRSIVQIVPVSARHGAAYQTYRSRIATATTYAELVTVLEQVLAHPELRTAAALDFAPADDIARRFLNSTVANLNHPTDDPRHLLAERALRVMMGLLTGPKPGRRANPPTSPAQQADRLLALTRWSARVRVAWPDLKAGVVTFDLSAALRRRLRALLARRPGIRPSDVAAQLAAWDLRVPVRAVRAARASVRVSRVAVHR